MIPFSYVGINDEDLSLLQDRLYPEANKIFLANLAKQNKIPVEKLPLLDYQNHPVFKRDRLLEIRKQKAKYLKDKDTTEFDVKYLTYEEAVANDKGNHYLLKDDATPLEELERRFPKMTVIPEKVTLDDLSSDDEKA